jgi:hypothetical protein
LTHAEALYLAAHVLRVKAWSLTMVGSTSKYAGRVEEAAGVLQELAPYYDPDSDAWKVAK